MTDLEKFKELYDSVGVNYNLISNVISLEANETDKVKGYNGFVTEIIFDSKGKFDRQEIWE